MKNVLVVGRERSGTKFTTNLLALNLNLATIQSEEHGGVIETNVLRTYPLCFGAIPSVENRLASLHLLSHEYFFLNSKLSKRQLFALDFSTYHELFTAFLNQQTKLADKSGWIYKADSRYMVGYLNLEATLVVVQRRIINQVWSFMKNKGTERNYFQILKYMTASFAHRSYENYIIKRYKLLVLRYEDILEDPMIAMRLIANEIQLPIPEELRATKYTNSSFRSTGEKNKIPRCIRLLYKAIFIISSLIPDFIQYHLYRFAIEGNRRALFVTNSFESK